MAKKLTDEDAFNIRVQAIGGKAQRRDLAQLYGVGLETIARIVRGDTFAHVPMVTKEQEEGNDKELLEQQKRLAEKFGLTVVKE